MFLSFFPFEQLNAIAAKTDRSMAGDMGQVYHRSFNPSKIATKKI
jgi:hypothetical protein